MTRIIAGEHRGRRLDVPAGNSVRPTTDRMRERLFSMLSHARYPTLNDAVVADIFAGTGALGLEALSRGACSVMFVENANASIQCIHKNIATLNAVENTTVLRDNATHLSSTDTPCNIIFLDPPYRKNLLVPALNRLVEGNWIAADNVLVCEIGSDEELPDLPDFEIVDERIQGQQRILFLRYHHPHDE